MKALTYLIYIILWEGLIWYGTYHIIFDLNRSKWWVVLAMILSGSCFKPLQWIHGVVEKEEIEGKDV